jgi:hypothetical protein
MTLLLVLVGACADAAGVPPQTVAVAPGPTPSPSPPEAPSVTSASPDAGPPEAGGPRVNNAERVVAALRPQFRSCYNRGLQLEPTVEGRVAILARIDPNGTVRAADIVDLDGLSDVIAACIQGAVQNAQFEGPGGSGSALNIPVRFVLQGQKGITNAVVQANAQRRCPWPASAHLSDARLRVRAYADVGADGRPTSVSLLDAPPPPFDAAARSCVMQLPFVPGHDDATHAAVASHSTLFTVVFERP